MPTAARAFNQADLSGKDARCDDLSRRGDLFPHNAGFADQASLERGSSPYKVPVLQVPVPVERPEHRLE